MYIILTETIKIELPRLALVAEEDGSEVDGTEVDRAEVGRSVIER
jgi:hypothetical protein